MDLIDDLDNDLVLAFLVEGKHRQKIDAKEAVVLLKKVRSALDVDINRRLERIRSLGLDTSIHATSH
jgi:hypothetical protein